MDHASGSGRGKRITLELRAVLRDSEGSAESAARQFKVNKKTVLRWRKRPDTRSRRPGPVKGVSRHLSPQEEMVLANFRIIHSCRPAYMFSWNDTVAAK